MFRKLFRLIPEHCVLCGLEDNGARICRRCHALLPWNDCFCERCGQPLQSAEPAGVTCASCQRRPPAYTLARAPLQYLFPVDTALKKMKFRRQLVYAPAFAELLLPVLRAEFAECDALVPVPLHRLRHLTRGFNQADELCRPLATGSGLPVVHAAIRLRATRSQSGLSAAARRRNLERAFAARGPLPCRYPLVIDDVITTGATCEQLAGALLEAGADRVAVLAVAHAARR